MSIKKSLLHALFSAVLSSMVALAYNTVYTKAMDVHFDKVLNAGGIIASTTLGCTLMSLGYYHLFYKWKRKQLIGALNILIILLSFASIIGVLGFKLPLDVENPEMFPGLAIPMHFFPALSFFCLLPFFYEEKKSDGK